jgi:phage-related protein
MQFNNRQFEDGIQTSLKSLDNLRKGLDETGNGAALSAIQSGVETIADRFSALGILGVAALQNIANAAVNMSAQMLKSVTLEPITEGFSKYEQKVGAVQTIMAATGKNIDEVSKSLEKLNWFTDETSYNFTDMVGNIGKFTSAGVDLDVSVTAMQGIANWAAVSGQNAATASRAMTVLSKSVGAGAVKLHEWRSIELANMATVEFKQTALDTAIAMGTLTQKSDGTIVSISKTGNKVKETKVSVQNFTEALKDGWFNADVLNASLGKYGEYADEVFKVCSEKGIPASEAMKLVSSETMELGAKAFKAAQEAKTFTDAINAVKDAVSTGWMNTFEAIIGNYDEARVLWTEVANALWEVFAAGGEARNEMLGLWKDMGGREALIQSFRNGFEAIASIVRPIKDAFSEIFPPMTAERLFALTKGLESFTEKLKIGDAAAENLKNTFKGVFAILDIAGQAIGFLAGKMGELIKWLLPGTGSLLAFTGGIGEFLAGVSEACRAADFFNTAFNTVKDAITKVALAVREDVKSMMAAPFFQALREGVEAAAEKIREAFGKIADVFGKWSGIDLSGAKTFVDGAVSSFRPFTALGNLLSNFFGVLKNIFEKVWPYVSKMASLAAEGFGKFAEAVSGAFRTGGFEAVLDLVNAGLVGGILFGIRKFIDGLGDITRNASGFTDGIKMILDGVGESLSAFTGLIKAKTLHTIAVAVAILAASLVVLSLIDPVKLTVALAGITTLFADLSAAMVLLQKGLAGEKLAKLGGELVLFSAAVLILSAALKSLSELSWDELARGTAGITILIGELVAASKLLSGESASMTKGGAGLIAMSAAILVLAQAVKSMSGLDWEQLAKGLAGVGALFIEVAGFTQTVKPEKLVSTGIAMIAMGAAMKMMASAIKDMGNMGTSELVKGVSAMGGVLLEIAGFSKIIKPEKLVSTGIAMIAIGSALLIFSKAIGSMGKLSWEEIARGLTTMAGALGVIVAAASLMPKDMMSKAAGLLILSSALAVLAQALTQMSGLSWEEIARSLVTLAGALTVITAANNLMSGALSGAAAMMVMAGALLLLAPSLVILGGLDILEIGQALLALAGVFAVVGGAAVILAPLTPVILGLSAAIALLGVGCLAIGAGLLAFSAGLTALAVSGTAGAAALVLIVTSILSLIPEVCRKLAEGVVEFCKIITKGIPAIMDAVKEIVIALIGIMNEITPPLVKAVFVLLMELLNTLIEFIPQIVDAGMRILIGFLEGISANIKDVVVVALLIVSELLRGIAEGIPGIVSGAVDVVAAFLDALGKETPRVVDAGFKMVIDFLNGIADAIRNNTGELITAAVNVGAAIVEGLGKGIAGGAVAVKDAAVNLGNSALNALKNSLGIHSPSKLFEKEVGANIALGTAEGIENMTPKAASAAKKMADDAYGNAKLWIKNYQNDTEYLATEELKMWEILADKYKGVSKQRIEIDQNIKKLREKISKEEFDNSKKWIENKKKLGELSAQEEAATWERVSARYAEGTEERQKADEELFSARKTLYKSDFEDAKNWIENKKKLGELSMADEVAAWERMQVIYAEGTSEREEIDIKVFEAQKRLFEEQEKLAKQMEDAEARYTQAVDDRAKAIVGTFSIFDELKAKEEVSGQTLAQNLKGQVEELRDWAANLETLSKKGIDEGLLGELQKMGPSANAEIAALSKMSESGLTEYANLWREKNALARKQAVSELQGLRAETAAEVNKIKAELNKINAITLPSEAAENADVKPFFEAGKAQIGAVIDGYKDKEPDVVSTAKTITNKAKIELDSWNPKYLDSAKKLMLSVVNGFMNKLPDVTSTVNAIAKRAVGEIDSFSPKFYQTGTNSIAGFIDGMRSKIEEAARAAAEVARAAYMAAMSELGIHSPSKAFFELGKFSDLGFAKGLAEYARIPEQMSKDMGAGVLDSVKSALLKAGDILDGDLETEPVIRPVVDLSAVSSGVDDMNKAFGRGLFIGEIAGSAYNLARSVNRQGAVSSAQGNPGVSEKTITFTQNNYSPKALSRIDIYRQTKNQFSAVKGALSQL